MVGGLGDAVADGEAVAPGVGDDVKTPLGVGEPSDVVVGVGVLVVGVGPFGVGVSVVGVGPPGVGVAPPVVGVGPSFLGVGPPVVGVGRPVDGVGGPVKGVGLSFEGVGSFVGPVEIPGVTLICFLRLETTRSIWPPVISTNAG